jgi:hypothetical protein
VVHNFQTKNNKIKLLTECESVNRKGLLLIESILQNSKQLQQSQFYFVISGLKMTGHRNPDDNLELHCNVGTDGLSGAVCAPLENSRNVISEVQCEIRGPRGSNNGLYNMECLLKYDAV